ncbi:hypothetical protein PAXRUDRAFT_380632 [Paxillus rubicundulus Ve08.2h10]|uniref:Uncharacterized protein n=1 Tax=Paxillus rubicundulus Ve08.2h10 TaxID=930991 RepID=A0A0D0DA78_9AGAM|nr:hypothetical protein PAXRUDRAFT_380632 [Paxillus rubicundulus Ve08.2h10]
MCNFVVPIRTCSKCQQREPLFQDGIAHDNEKARSDGSLVYMDPAQDCYSRWCAFSSEHPKTCSHCWLTCKHWHGKTREIQGGSPSYVCHSCAPRARRQQTWKPPRPAHHPNVPSRHVGAHGFLSIAKSIPTFAR